ncbi:MAG: hypothetical protein LBG07_04355 [Treponema sp.]|nr:hypothetical protein [Treponema sp.]
MRDLVFISRGLFIAVHWACSTTRLVCQASLGCQAKLGLQVFQFAVGLGVYGIAAPAIIPGEFYIEAKKARRKQDAAQ